MKEYGLYINGTWAHSSSGRAFSTSSPATGEVLATFAEGTEEDVEKAVEAASKAQLGWRNFPAPKRGELLFKAAWIMRNRKDELGDLVSREMGKVITEGKGDVQEAIDFLEFIAGEGRRMTGETTTSELPDKFCMTVRQSMGVVGLITPWNFPFAVPCWKPGPALIAGNTIVYKPATLTPLCAATLITILEEAGVPPGVVNMVTGPAGRVGTAIVEHPGVRAVSFTGSVSSGRDVYTRASARLKRVGLELGGKNPQIVMDDADILPAVEGVLFGAFGTAGQRCTATSRLILHEAIYDEMMEHLISRTKTLKIGDPVDPSVDVGPVCGEDQEKKILNYIEVGKKEGARLLTGGQKPSGGSFEKGFFIEPTIFEARHGIRITKEEIFGLTEPGFGSNPAGMTTYATKQGDHYVLNGTKMWITNGPMAQVALIWAKTREGIRCFLIETHTPGFRATPIQHKFTYRTSPTALLELKDCKVGLEAMLPEASGLKAAFQCLNHARYGVACSAVGSAMACYEAARNFAGEREVFDRPIASYQLVQQRLANMLLEITKAQLMNYHLGRLMDEGRALYPQISMAKMNSVREAMNIARLARDVLGGRGILADHHVIRHLCDLEALSTLEGTDSMHTLVLGQDITGISAFGT